MLIKYQMPRGFPAAFIVALSLFSAIVLGLGVKALSSSPPAKPQSSEEQVQLEFESKMIELKTALNLGQDQASSWDAFKEGVRPASAMETAPHIDVLHNTPERIEKIRAYRSQISAQLARRDHATRSFLRSLGDEQQKVFETMFIKNMHPPILQITRRRSEAR